MSERVQTSIIIPVHGQWPLTEDCLRSLAATLDGAPCEIIVVDNASQDATPQACPALGRELFGPRFQYKRFAQNRNFGPACNAGAALAQGEYLFFLNNDTVAKPGWYAPLVRDFSEFPNIACTGPLLSRPAQGPLGETVQHLGVHMNPFCDVHHLYEGIPADSPLAQRRRFFQVITAAALLLPAKLFRDAGGFDEAYRNGFEDVDLCARLWSRGLRMTVNPASRFTHLTSMTPGRGADEEANHELFFRKSIHLLTPDWHLHLKADNFSLALSPWLTLVPSLPEAVSTRLRTLLQGGDADDVLRTLKDFPLWYQGYEALAGAFRNAGLLKEAHSLWLSLALLRPVPENLFPLLADSSRLGDEKRVSFALTYLLSHCRGFEERLEKARALRELAALLGLPELSAQCAAWLEQSGEFRQKTQLPFLRRLKDMGLFAGGQPGWDKAYTVWRELDDSQEARAGRRPPVPQGLEERARFSVLMPVYSPKPRQLRAAVDSVLSQLWPHWELCMADDASPDPAVRPLLEELARLDPRIRVTFRPENGNIATASNSALEMARHPYTALLDQDDLLTPDALLEVALALAANPEARLIYSDEDKCDDEGARFTPHFKSDWDPVLCEAQNMVSHLGVYETARMRAIGGFRPGYDGSQDFDLLWRFAEGLEPGQIVHIPKVLYHWRSHEGSVALAVTEKSGAVLDNFQKALADHVQRTGQAGSVHRVAGMNHYRVAYELPEPAPLLSLLLDLGGQAALGKTLIPSWLESAGYPNLELLLAFSPEERGADRMQELASLDARIRLTPVPAQSRIARLNALAAAAQGELLAFMDKFLLPESQGWLHELAARCLVHEAGVAGSKLLTQERTVAHAGFYLDSTGTLFALHRGIAGHDPGYFGWASLARCVAAVDGRCLVTRRELFEHLGGLQKDQGGESVVNAGALYCLRAGERGQRVVYTPYAAFTLRQGQEHDVPLPGGEAFSTSLSPCHPALFAGCPGWALFPQPQNRPK